jgi:glyoxylase-like metal-dependent hydrolase (beta-lactamase superfamily II)
MVENIVLTHGDPDHAGGLADFPQATVHLSAEELASLKSGHSRYVPTQFAHGPRWQTHLPSTERWFGLEARPVDVGLSSAVLLIPLPGHTLGHCGVAVQLKDRWMLHAGDAYYLWAELTDGNHPVSAIATARADNDNQRRQSLAHLRRLATDHADEVDLVAYHDLSELPAGYPLPGGRE